MIFDGPQGLFRVVVVGVLAFAVIGLQVAVTSTSVRSARVRRWVKAEPRLLFHARNAYSKP